ncbi:MAG: hypothetical protein JOZ32_20160 [Bryobacterales bacterium]|nr:hypothetical protein [Bryobacterales bacterium]
MQYNPCGKVVDVVSHNYTTTCVFNTDGVQQTVRWVAMPDNAPLLDEWSAVVDLYWENDKELYQDDLGEVWGAPRPYDPRIIPPGILNALGGHVCGTPANFQFGGVFDPSKGETQYGGFGFPICCDPSVALNGGAGAGGYARISVQYTDAPAGGVQVGGQVVEQLQYTDPPAGGVEVGGEVEEDVVGNLDTLNETGGPFSFGNTITLIGGTNVQLVPGVSTVTINVSSVGPAPGTPTALSARPGNGAIQFAWSAPTGFPNAQNYTLATAPNITFSSGVQLFPNINATNFVATGQTNGSANYGQVAGGFNGQNGIFSSAASATPMNFVSWDDTTDTNGTTWAAHVLNVGALGNFTVGWVVTAFSGAFNAGTTTIQGNALHVAQTGGVTSIPVAHVETGHSAVTIQVTALKNCSQVGIVFSYADISNYWIFYGDGTRLTWGKQVGGHFTFAPSPVSFTWNNGVSHTLKVIRSGGSITLQVDGTTFYTLSDTDLDTNTQHGLYTEAATGETADYTTWEVTSP